MSKLFCRFSLRDATQSFMVTISPNLIAGQLTQGCQVAIFGPGLALLCAQPGQETMSSSGILHLRPLKHSAHRSYFWISRFTSGSLIVWLIPVLLDFCTASRSLFDFGCRTCRSRRASDSKLACLMALWLWPVHGSDPRDWNAISTSRSVSPLPFDKIQ